MGVDEILLKLKRLRVECCDQRCAKCSQAKELNCTYEVVDQAVEGLRLIKINRNILKDE